MLRSRGLRSFLAGAGGVLELWSPYMLWRYISPLQMRDIGHGLRRDGRMIARDSRWAFQGLVRREDEGHSERSDPQLPLFQER